MISRKKNGFLNLNEIRRHAINIIKCEVLCQESVNYKFKRVFRSILAQAIENLTKLVQLSKVIKFLSFTSELIIRLGTMSRFNS